jgi:hypothetical protein
MLVFTDWEVGRHFLVACQSAKVPLGEPEGSCIKGRSQIVDGIADDGCRSDGG